MNSIPSWAVRGAKCVCISGVAAWEPVGNAEDLAPLPVMHETYTIREVESDADFYSGICISLAELIPEAFYDLSAFRPLIDHKAEDKALFESWLDVPQADRIASLDKHLEDLSGKLAIDAACGRLV